MISSSRRCGRQPGLGEDLADLLDEIGLGELTGRQVDAHHELRFGQRVHPAPRLAAGRFQHPAPDRDDQPGLLGERNERQRRDEAARRVLPADERLEPDDPVGSEVHDRLVVEPQLVALEGPPEVVLELDALHGRRAHRRLEERVVHAGRTLRLDERDLGLAEEVGRDRTGPGRRSRCPRLALTNHSRSPRVNGARRTSMIRSAIGWASSRPRKPSRMIAELVATEAGDGVAGPQARAEPLADGREELVAERVAEALVDRP